MNDNAPAAPLPLDALGDGGGFGLLPVPTGPGTKVHRRAAKACRRCRRLRTKCIHDKENPTPCTGCAQVGLGPESCVYPDRGQTDADREYRHPRTRTDKATRRDSAKVRRDILDAPVTIRPVAPNEVKGFDEWDHLPHMWDITAAVEQFTKNYFQLGFIPKQQFLDRLKHSPRSINVFLLLGILSVSARLTPNLVARFGDPAKAAETFMERASTVALTQLYLPATVERCQGFYLLGIAQQGNGLNHRSHINLGIAIRMATLLHLHREETYKLINPTAEELIDAESARRTMWMLHSQDNLHSGPFSPVSLSASEITALLPCSEEDFVKGAMPASRAALADTPPAIENPDLINDPNRSLFATLMQTHHFWGRVSRRAKRYDKSTKPWEADSEYSQIVRSLDEWEKNLPSDQKWSPVALKGYKYEALDLAYLAVTNVIRLCHIVLRKAYIQEIIQPDVSNTAPEGYWTQMSAELFSNVSELYTQISTQFEGRLPDDTMGAQMALFCVYSCGNMAAYVLKYHGICPDEACARDAPDMYDRAMVILDEARRTWPVAEQWLKNLMQFHNDSAGGPAGEPSMADGRDTVPEAIPSSFSKQGDDHATTITDGQVKVQPQLDIESVQTTDPPPQSTTAITDMYIDPEMRTVEMGDEQAASLSTGLQQQQAIAALNAQQELDAQQEVEEQLQHAQPAMHGGLDVLAQAVGTHGTAYPNAAAQHMYQMQSLAPHGYVVAQSNSAVINDNYERQLDYVFAASNPSAPWGQMPVYPNTFPQM